MKVILLLLLAMITDKINAQSKVSVQGGMTISRVRAIYDPKIKKGPVFGEFVNFVPYYHPYLGVEYEYAYKNARITTGVSFTAFGAGNTPLFGNIPWPTFYWVIPILGGYQISFNKDMNLLLKGGIDVGLQQGESGVFHEGAKWGNINAVIGVELCYKRFRWGMRGHWGVTDFRYFPPYTYQHTAITTYLSYDLWDHAKAKARRLRKRQEQLLD
ncbi:MAG: hypothetical protein AB8E82_11670 [Aureispira sp.]